MIQQLRSLVRNAAPKKIINLFRGLVNFVNFLNSKYYKIILNPLIIRKNTSDLEVFKQIFTYKDYDIDYKIKPKIIIDGGANVGYSSIFFARKFKNAKIFAIEPEESNFEVLKENTKKYKNIIPIKKGLWPTKGYLKIIDNGQEKYGFITKIVKKNEKYDVEVITINDLMKKYNITKIDILKLDIEGAEKELFEENYDNWLDKTEILIIELHEKMKRGCEKAFYSAIKKYDLDIQESGENIILKKN
jgi:FkbM family methyltransferase